MKNKYAAPLLLIFLLLVSAEYVHDLVKYALKYDGWTIGDWLINYDAGFVRRGLSGWALLHTSALLHVPPNKLVLGIELALYASYLSAFFLLFRKKRLNAWFLVMVLSPATLLFHTYSGSSVGRKEMILFFLFAVFLHGLNRRTVLPARVLLVFSVALAAATLSHEMIFFYTPYFVAAAFLKARSAGVPFRWFRNGLVMAGALIAMVPLYFYGQVVDNGALCDGLMQRGLPHHVCEGILRWPADFGPGDVLETAKQYHYFINYPLALALGLLPFILFYRGAGHPFATLPRFLAGFCVLFLCTLPLFVLAIDWGRWLYIHFFLLLMLSTLVLKDRPADPAWGDTPMPLPGLWPARSRAARAGRRFAFGLFVVAYATLWNIRVCRESSIGHHKFYRQAGAFFHGLATFGGRPARPIG